MAAVLDLARSNDPLLPNPATSVSPSSSDKLQKSLESLFPDLMVHGTRNYLLGVTTSLTTVSSRAHDYFARVSHMLAFERMMRSFMRLATAASPFPLNFAAANCWSGMMMAGQTPPSPWGFPMATGQAPANPAMALFATAFQPQQATPNPMQVWGFPAPAQPAGNPAMAYFASAMQPQSQANSRSQPWADYTALFIVPVAFLVAAPMPDSWWNFGF